ncbi:hypothetical protein [Denitrobaculum tricleocarpae]|uniref:EF-hand domain-containing protein n=1 Tax=Denitrobaculum tricleocarpae TaxID=2591009 RepID=A0A545U322_9PROT|nr:hypothetical protein [Denitrobaculum tricleocarpae]TQV83824.1 hypothetical protein FKG95_04390 [Denitrobaculum tricleocarpae]
MRKCLFGILTAAAMTPTSSVTAEKSSPLGVSGADWVWQSVYRQVRRAPTKEALLDAMDNLFRHSEVDGVEGISEQDYNLSTRLHSARHRGLYLSGHWFPYDLDGDLVVTRDEIEQVARYKALKSFAVDGVPITPTPEQLAKVQKKISETILLRLGQDAERFTMQDAIAASAEYEERKGNQPSKSDFVPLSLDRDGDARVSREEFGAAVLVAFGQLDSNGDDVIDKDEIAVAAAKVKQANAEMMKRRSEQRAEETYRAQLQACSLPRVTSDETLILISTNTHTGRALANIALDDGEETLVVAQVKIEPGKEKLAVAVTGLRGTVWRFSGAVDRLSHVIVGSPFSIGKREERVKIASGVTGVPDEKITFAQEPECLPYFTNLDEPRSKRSVRALTALTERAPDHVVSNATVGTISLPSLRIDNDAPFANAIPLTSEGPGAPLLRKFKKTFPGGVVNIDPAAVVTTGHAERRETLPRNAGFAQLLDQGVLKATGYDLTFQLGNTFITVQESDPNRKPPEDMPKDRIERFPSAFTILKKTRLPVGNCHQFAPKLTLAKGAPLPDFGACYPAIKIEDSGETLCKLHRGKCPK